jgi:hypothetical protein
MIKFASAKKTNKAMGLIGELIGNVLTEKWPLFISDEATLWDLTADNIEDVLDRCRKYYQVPLTLEETQQLPLWKLLGLLDKRRKERKTDS